MIAAKILAKSMRSLQGLTEPACAGVRLHALVLLSVGSLPARRSLATSLSAPAIIQQKFQEVGETQKRNRRTSGALRDL